MKIWFAHAPRIDDNAKEFARRTAEARYLRFVEHVAEQFSGGQRFLDDLPREVLADDVELSNLPADPPAAPASPGLSSASHGE